MEKMKIADRKKEALHLKATGIVRRIDELGRVVIPKEIRRTLRTDCIDTDGAILPRHDGYSGQIWYQMSQMPDLRDERGMNMGFYTAFYDLDENRVFVWLTDGKIIAIDCTKVENSFVNNLHERSELDYLIFNDPIGYANLILNEDAGRYLKEVTTYRTDEAMN